MQLHVTKRGRFRTHVTFGDEFKVSADDALFVARDRLFGEPVARVA